MPSLAFHWNALQTPESLGALLVAALIIGLGSSVTHCAGMCAPIHFFLASRRGKGVYTYHLGRLTTYITLGLTAGSIGKGLDWSGKPFGIKLAAILLAGVYLAMALHWFGLWRLAGGLEKMWSQWLSGPVLKRMRSAIQTDSIGQPGLFGMGLAGGLLPCPTTQAMLIIALGLGRPIWSAIAMLVLGVGTLPVFMALTPRAVRAPGRFGRYFTHSMGIVFLVLAAHKIHAAWFQAIPACH